MQAADVGHTGCMPAQPTTCSSQQCIPRALSPHSQGSGMPIAAHSQSLIRQGGADGHQSGHPAGRAVCGICGQRWGGHRHHPPLPLQPAGRHCAGCGRFHPHRHLVVLLSANLSPSHSIRRSFTQPNNQSVKQYINQLHLSSLGVSREPLNLVSPGLSMLSLPEPARRQVCSI